MRVLLTGATGFVGRALVPALLRHGHEPVAWVRSVEAARHLLGAETELVSAGDDAWLMREVGRCDAIVNLAGERIIGRRWTDERRRRLVESRVGTTERIVRACASSARRPKVLISGSAVGYYGDQGDTVLTEDDVAGDDFLARLCVSWEAAAYGARSLGTRVVVLRTGIVLGREGGALAPMRLAFTLGLGGPIGSGKQFLPWIHLHDVVGIVMAALTDTRYEGPINAVAPEESTNRDFTHAVGRALRRPAVLPAPAVALRVVLGQAAGTLLGSQRVRPGRAQDLGYAWTYPALDAALANVVSAAGVEIRHARTESPATSSSGEAYLRRRPPRYELRTKTTLEAPLADAFQFFSNAGNLGLITPAAMGLRIDGVPPAIENGTTIDYRLRVGPLRVRWRTRIACWEPNQRFVDVQERGPYRGWWHEHAFRVEAGQTIMEDRVYYAPPFGPLGALAHPFVVAPLLRRIFAYRDDVIRLRFGGAS